VVGKVLALVLPLGLDTFAVAAGLGIAGLAPARRVRISVLFSAFEAGMPLVGLALGAPLASVIGGAADYVAVGLLLCVGLFALLASESGEEERLLRLAQGRGLGALFLGVSVSLDELAIGFTLGLLRVPVALVVALIAVQAVIVSQLGLRLGGRIGERRREGAQRLAGGALTGLALVLLVERLLS
jgi:putative Mn2+ efflux pump MntP